MKTLIVCAAALLMTNISLSGCGGDSAVGTINQPKQAIEQSKAQPKSVYLATVPHMNDAGCVASITKTVSKVAGVESIECDIPSKKVKVYTKADATFSVRELWEAFDATGESASSIDGPQGLFTTKPGEKN